MKVVQTFKRYFADQQLIEENRRSFLKTLFGTAAAAAVSNPVAVADMVARKAGAPWLKVTLEGDFAIWGHEMVSSEVIGPLTQAGGKYVPGLSDDGAMMVDFNGSAIDFVEVYVKPGTDVYTKLKGSLEDEEYDLGNITAEFDREVFKAMTGSDSSTQWYEDQIESQTERWIADPPGDGQDDWDEDSYPSEASMEAVDQANRYLKIAGDDFDVDIPEEIKAVIERGYMKSYALGAGSGNEVVSTDSLERLRELTNDPDLEDPDEDDVYRWLEGEADGVHDKFRYSDDEALDHEDGRWNHAGYVDGEEDEYEQPPGTGADTSHDNKIEDWVTAGFNMMLGAAKAQEQIPIKKLLNVPGFWSAVDHGNPNDVNMNEPIQIAHDGHEPIKILSGFDQLAKAYDSKEPVYVKMVQTEGDPSGNENI